MQCVFQEISVRVVEELTQSAYFLPNAISLPNDADARVFLAPGKKIATKASEMARVQRIDGPAERGGKAQLIVVVDTGAINIEDSQRVDA
mgnify:CR=1 FL=1